MQASSESLGFYLKHYARYIVPIWLFPVYLIAFGLLCEHFKIRLVGLLFWLLVLPVFFGTFFWSRVPAIPRLKRWILTMLIPFLIFAFIGVVLAVIAITTGVSSI
jgi:hypothetical protein